jgi:hypothetical protein
VSAKHGRIEARNAQASTWSFSVTDAMGGPTTVNVTAANRYPVELIAAINAALSTAGISMVFTISDGEGGTGRVSIFDEDTPFSLTWTSTDLRDLLGWTANISSASSTQTGAQHAKGLWLPGVVKYSPHGDGDNGRFVHDLRSTVGPTGIVHTLYGRSFRRIEGIRWEGVSGARAKEHLETISGESFESFFRAAALGRYSYIPVGAYVRYYPDADTDGTYKVGRLAWPKELDVRTMWSGFTGKYIVGLPDLLVEG